MTDRKFIVRLLAVATNFVYEALVAIALGYFIGLGLDRLLDLDTVFVGIFMTIGAIAAIRNLIVRVLRLGREKDRADLERKRRHPEEDGGEDHDKT